VLNVIGLAVADALLQGVSVDDTLTFFLAALLLGFVNAVVRPLAILFTLPATILTMGLFLWVINGAMLELVSWLMPSFHVDDFGTAMLASLLIGFVAWLGNLFIGPQGRVEVMVMRDDGRLP
jgi:putative membrane protein